MIVSAIKDLAEDLKKRFADRDENNKPTEVWRNDKFVKCQWKDLRVGDIIKVASPAGSIWTLIHFVRSQRITFSPQILSY